MTTGVSARRLDLAEQTLPATGPIIRIQPWYNHQGENLLPSTVTLGDVHNRHACLLQKRLLRRKVLLHYPELGQGNAKVGNSTAVSEVIFH